MKLKHNPLIIPTDGSDPFVNDKLERKKYAEVLTSIVSTYADGFVLTINNKWGTGKTTFIKMWEQQLKIEEFQTLYFNAWENDFQPEVMVALLSELSELKEKGEENFNSVVKKAARFLKKAGPAVAKGVIAKALGEGAVTDITEAITEFTTEELEEQIQSFTDAKKGIIDFRASLEKFVAKVNNGKPVIFVIDELDRCRPNYAVSVLEEIKHLFSVSGIVFVLSIDKVQLGHAIKGVYGSEQIDSDEYLRRFIDVEYALPEPSNELYVNYLYDYFQFDSFFAHDLRKQHYELVEDKYKFIDFAIKIFTKSALTLRQQASILAQARITIKSFKITQYAVPNLFIFLVFCKDQKSVFYKNLNSKLLSHQLLVDNYEDIIFDLSNNTITDEERELYLIVLAALLHSYNEMLDYGSKIKIIKSDTNDPDKVRFTLNSKLDISNDYSILVDYLGNSHRRRNTMAVDLQKLLSAIELTTPFLENV